MLQSLVDVGGTYDAPAHHISFSGITFTGTSWLGPSSNQGFADQQTGAYITGTWSRPADALTSCQAGCPQFEATRPNWNQMPAAVQVSAANTITFSDYQFVNLGQTAIGIGNDANAHASGVGLGASNITVTRSEIARNSAGGIVVGGVRADAHHPSDQRMVNREHHHQQQPRPRPRPGLPGRRLGPDHLRHQRHRSPTTRSTTCRTPACRSATAGAPTTPAAASDYANRGLYNYQPRYTTATTASNNQVIGNYVHDVMQQMTDGGCIYTLSANPSAVDQRQLLPADQRLVRALLRRGLPVLHRHATTSSPPPAPGPPPTTGARENMGNFTVTNNWSTNGSTNVTNGDRGNVVTGNVTVTNGNWPSGAQAVIAAAGVAERRQRRPAERAARGRPVGPVRSTSPNSSTTNGTQVQLWDCTRRRQPAVDLHRRASSCRCTATSAWTPPARAPPTAPQVIIWDCNGQTNQQWNVNANGTITGVQSGLCLDANGAGTANGTKVILWSCNGGTNQQWSLRS